MAEQSETKIFKSSFLTRSFASTRCFFGIYTRVQLIYLN